MPLIPKLDWGVNEEGEHFVQATLAWNGRVISVHLCDGLMFIKEQESGVPVYVGLGLLWQFKDESTMVSLCLFGFILGFMWRHKEKSTPK